MPHVIGALDGKHIAMDCPKGSGTQDYNYKGFYSLVLLAVCDAKYNFRKWVTSLKKVPVIYLRQKVWKDGRKDVL